MWVLGNVVGTPAPPVLAVAKPGPVPAVLALALAPAPAAPGAACVPGDEVEVDVVEGAVDVAADFEVVERLDRWPPCRGEDTVVLVRDADDDAEDGEPPPPLPVRAKTRPSATSSTTTASTSRSGVKSWDAAEWVPRATGGPRYVDPWPPQDRSVGSAARRSSPMARPQISQLP